MKNLRGSALQNVRSAIWSVFGRERLPRLRSNASAEDIVRWKQSQEVYDCYCALYEQDNKGVFWVAIIARTAFSMAAAPTLTNHHCAFTLAVCDIILNPQSKNIVCSESRIKRRMVRYLVSICNISIVTTK
jgi:hypothetical protein